jgi:hypothetical protein
MLHFETFREYDMTVLRQTEDILSGTDFFITDVDRMRERFDAAMLCCMENQPEPVDIETITPSAMNDSMQQVFSILSTLSQQHNFVHSISEQEMTELPEYGIGLLVALSEFARQNNCAQSSVEFEQLSIPFALWFAQHNHIIHDVEFIVNAISNTANRTQDQAFLAELADVIDVIINAFPAEIKTDPDKSNPGRSWRVLNLNHAIIATRSHDAKRMESVFEQLVFRLPEDAPGFFAEGMHQMDIIGYPDHVRNVMKTYYQLTNQPTLH